ncbi:MAG: hypothetical protein ACUVTM_08325 [Candidatus Bathyarchaeia archaeon]
MAHVKIILLKAMRREILHYGCGRPRGLRQSMPKITRARYLLKVSERYGLEANRFIACFSDAWIHGESLCDDVLIRFDKNRIVTVSFS